MKGKTGLIPTVFLAMIVAATGACAPTDTNAETESTGSPQTTLPSAGVPRAFTMEGPVIGLAVRGNGLWTTTPAGVVRWDLEDGSHRTYTVQDGLAGNDVREIVVDSQGNVWVTAYLSGVSRFDGRKWESFSVKNGLCSDDTISLAADNKGGVWVSAYWGVSHFDGEKWSSYSDVGPDAIVVGGPNPMKDCQDLTLVEGKLSAADEIFVDSGGDVWFSSRTGGVTRYDGKEWRSFTSKDGLGEGGITAIFEDKDGVVWLAGWTGITSFAGTTFNFYSIPYYQSVIPRPIVQDVLQDAQGNLWVAAYGAGVVEFDGKGWTSYSVQHGLPSVNAKALFLDKEGYPGVITDKGVSRFDGSTWRPMTAADGLPQGNVRLVIEDENGNLWFASDKGVSCYGK